MIHDICFSYFFSFWGFLGFFFSDICATNWSLRRTKGARHATSTVHLRPSIGHADSSQSPSDPSSPVALHLGNGLHMEHLTKDAGGWIPSSWYSRTSNLIGICERLHTFACDMRYSFPFFLSFLGFFGSFFVYFCLRNIIRVQSSHNIGPIIAWKPISMKLNLNAILRAIEHDHWAWIALHEVDCIHLFCLKQFVKRELEEKVEVF